MNMYVRCVDSRDISFNGFSKGKERGFRIEYERIEIGVIKWEHHTH